MIYLLSILALTLHPLIWKACYKNKLFLISQVARLVIGILVIFVVSYFRLIDYTFEAFVSYGLFFLGLFFVLDFVHFKMKWSWITGAIGVLLLLSGVYMHSIYSMTITHDKYAFVKKKVEVVSKDSVSMDEKHIPVVPEKYARYRSEKLLGELEHSSYYELGHTTIQKIDGTLYWVTPIEYTGFFKWLKAKSVPGYITMSAEDENADAKLVKHDMTYVPSAYFNQDLKRHVRSEYKDTILLDPSFEPDDSGKPFYVVPYGHYNKFRQIIDIEGVYVVNPENGAIKDYKNKHVPKFIDQTIPTTVAEQWNSWYGKYVHGFWNSHFTQEDVKNPTHWKGMDEVNGVFNNQLQLNWFTDFTRPKAGSGSMVGYSLLNARTGKLTFYKDANGSLNGKAAMNVAEKTFRAQKYSAGTPTLYMIYGQFTWVVPLMDSNDVFRDMMLINAKNEKVYSADETKRNLFDAYKYQLATRLTGDDTVPNDIAELKEHTGTITDVYKYQAEENTNVEFMIKGLDKVFVVSSENNPYVVFLNKGSKVKIKYVDTDETVTNVKDFERIK
ncbi:hypothetical protein GCM10011391_31730 [Pullulanibacillus camelliae]|uniref:Uncharacterized protein n=1 Tax=Pullulanibacillus camelliae TaxID=1707096 RepID=A0A8J3DYW8_9BACL|nr:hypothetical protein [Pullulanibacillus camelliae]GGE50624.1 hypothetical protein GCM10011391_31730 [Pullulanibacillus camelliae]